MTASHALSQLSYSPKSDKNEYSEALRKNKNRIDRG